MARARTAFALTAWVSLLMACGDDAESTEAAPAEAADAKAAESGAAGAGDANFAELARAEDPGDQETWVLKPKMTVGEIVKARYGNRHYTRVVLLHNKIKDASRLPVGKTIATPPLEQVLLEEPGLRRRAGDEVTALADARRAFMALEDELQAEAEAASDPMQLKVSAPLAAKIRPLASELERLGEALAKSRPDTRKAPTKMVGSLLDAAAILQRAAAGEVQDERFDVDLIHQRLGNAMADALIWARVERR